MNEKPMKYGYEQLQNTEKLKTRKEADLFMICEHCVICGESSNLPSLNCQKMVKIGDQLSPKAQDDVHKCLVLSENQRYSVNCQRG